MASSVGIMMVGLNGAIGGTVAAGLESLRRGLRKPLGIRTETARMPKRGSWVPESTKSGPLVRDALGLAPLDGLTISGWDIASNPILSSIRRNRIVSADVVRAIEGPLSKLTPRPGVIRDDGAWRIQRRGLGSAREGSDRLGRDIDSFRLWKSLGDFGRVLDPQRVEDHPP